VLEIARAAETEALLGAHPDRRAPGGRRAGTVWVSADGTMVHDHRELDGLGRAVHGAVRAARGVGGGADLLRVRRGAAIRWIRERSFPTAIELLDWYHLVEALRRAIVDGRLAGWAFEEAARTLPARTSSPRSRATWRPTGGPSPTMSSLRPGVSALVRLPLLRLNGTWTVVVWRFRGLLFPPPRADGTCAVSEARGCTTQLPRARNQSCVEAVTSIDSSPSACIVAFTEIRPADRPQADLGGAMAPTAIIRVAASRSVG
jgi:hypothetical protein